MWSVVPVPPGPQSLLRPSGLWQGFRGALPGLQRLLLPQWGWFWEGSGLLWFELEDSCSGPHSDPVHGMGPTQDRATTYWVLGPARPSFGGKNSPWCYSLKSAIRAQSGGDERSRCEHRDEGRNNGRLAKRRKTHAKSKESQERGGGTKKGS